jgi:hypothetical protein
MLLNVGGAVTHPLTFQAYQISAIVDRSSVNLNFNANVPGAEVEMRTSRCPACGSISRTAGKAHSDRALSLEPNACARKGSCRAQRRRHRQRVVDLAKGNARIL